MKPYTQLTIIIGSLTILTSALIIISNLNAPEYPAPDAYKVLCDGHGNYVFTDSNGKAIMLQTPFGRREDAVHELLEYKVRDLDPDWVKKWHEKEARIAQQFHVCTEP